MNNNSIWKLLFKFIWETVSVAFIRMLGLIALLCFLIYMLFPIGVLVLLIMALFNGNAMYVIFACRIIVIALAANIIRKLIIIFAKWDLERIRGGKNNHEK